MIRGVRSFQSLQGTAMLFITAALNSQLMVLDKCHECVPSVELHRCNLTSCICSQLLHLEHNESLVQRALNWTPCQAPSEFKDELELE